VDLRTLDVPVDFSLAQTCGPVYWTTGRSPRHAWHDGELIWVGWEDGSPRWRGVRQCEPGGLAVRGTGDPGRDVSWARSVLGTAIVLPQFRDETILEIAARYPGMRPYCDGSIFEGIITAIVGQSISVAAAAVTQARLAAMFADPIAVDGRDYRPLPDASILAGASVERVRESGVTWRRAEALVFAAREAIAGNLPDDETARKDPDSAVRELMKLPLVGRWTAESVVLWGIGAANAHPTGDVALLRAAKLAYGRDDLTLKSLDVLAEQWQPARGLAARLLWTNLFGPAPDGAEG
jgi:3-methyladenine DNA glycosylase/8-oxoguanine DNA glycosylase